MTKTRNRSQDFYRTGPKPLRGHSVRKTTHDYIMTYQGSDVAYWDFELEAWV